MEILFDLYSIQTHKIKFHGGGEYVKTVFSKVVEEKKGEHITAFYDSNQEIDDETKKNIVNNDIELIAINDKVELQNYINHTSFDVFYSGLPYDFYDIKINIPKVIFTIHGLRVLECHSDKYEHKYLRTLKEYIRYAGIRIFPQKHKDRYKQKIQRLFNKGKGTMIIVPSLHTKYSIKNFFPTVSLEQIKVLYSPEVDNFKSVELSNDREANLLQQFNLKTEGYFLITSSQRWIKNAYRAIQAIDQLYTEQTLQNDFKTLVLGYSDELNFRRQLTNPDRFIFEGYVSFENLAYFYKNALAFVYPTLNEGFGYPPLESMRFGTPVVCSNISAVPEICGGAVHYFNPYSINEIKNRLLALLFDQRLRNELRKKGKNRYRKISQLQKEMHQELTNNILNR